MKLIAKSNIVLNSGKTILVDQILNQEDFDANDLNGLLKNNKVMALDLELPKSNIDITVFEDDTLKLIAKDLEVKNYWLMSKDTLIDKILSYYT